MTPSDPYPFMTAEWHAERYRVLSTGPEPEPQPGDPGYIPDPSEYEDLP